MLPKCTLKLDNGRSGQQAEVRWRSLHSFVLLSTYKSREGVRGVVRAKLSTKSRTMASLEVTTMFSR